MNDPIVDWLRKNNVKVTRANYLNVAFMGDVPEDEDMDPELLAEMEDIEWES